MFRYPSPRALGLAALLALLVAAPPVVRAQHATRSAAPTDLRVEQTEALASLRTATGHDWQVRWSEDTPVPKAVFMGTSRAYPGTPEAAARAFLAEHAALFRVPTDAAVLKHDRTLTRRGIHHVRFQQMYEGVPIEDAIYLVHVHEDGRVDMANGTVLLDVGSPDTLPSVTEAEALQIATKRFDAVVNTSTDERSEAAGALVLRRRAANQVQDRIRPAFDLLWDVDVVSMDASWRFVLDAATGRIVEEHSWSFDLHEGPDDVHDSHTSATTAASVTAAPLPLLPLRTYVNGDGDVYPLHPGVTPTLETRRLSNINLSGGTYDLDGEMIEIDNDLEPEVTSSTPYFAFPPSTRQLDEVMAYHHLDSYRRTFIVNLGLDDIVADKVRVTVYSRSSRVGGLATYTEFRRTRLWSDGWEGPWLDFRDPSQKV